MLRSFWMLSASFFFALMAACNKLAAADGFGSYELVFYRQVFSMAAIAVWVFATGRTLKTKHWTGHLKRSLLGNLSLVIWFWSIARLPLGTAMTLNYTNPLFMAAIVAALAVWRGEKLEWVLLGCVAAGFCGVALVLHPETGSSDLGVGLIGLSSGFFAAVTQFQIRQLAVLKEPVWRIVFYFSLTGTIAGLIGHWAVEGPLTPLTASNALPLFGMGLCGLLAQLSLTRAWGGSSLLLTSSLQYSAIVFAAVIGFLAFGEPLSLLEGAGIALIIAAALAATLETKRTEARRAEALKAGRSSV